MKSPRHSNSQNNRVGKNRKHAAAAVIAHTGTKEAVPSESELEPLKERIQISREIDSDSDELGLCYRL